MIKHVCILGDAAKTLGGNLDGFLLGNASRTCWFSLFFGS